MKRPCNDSTFVNGPASKKFDLKPRPKPGRKPMAENGDHGDKRKTQNRVAQRAFRDRRAQRVYELECQNSDLKELHEAEMSNMAAEINRLNARVAQTEADKSRIVDENARLVAELTERCSVLQKALGMSCFYSFVQSEYMFDANKLRVRHSQRSNEQHISCSSNPHATF
jgi:hypothetical protein